MSGGPSETNAGRCDVCGETVDMRDAGDRLVVSEHRLEGEPPDGKTEEEALREMAEELARVLEEYGGEPEDHSLAEALRENGEYKAHGDCLEDTSMRDLFGEPEREEQ